VAQAFALAVETRAAVLAAKAGPFELGAQMDALDLGLV